MPSTSARTRTTSRFAAPSSGGAETRTRSASPCIPATPLRDAPGTAHTAITQPPGAGRMQESPSDDMQRPHRGGDPERELVQARNQHALHEADAEHQDERREVEV